MPILWEVLNCVFIGFSAQEEKLRADDGSTLQALYGMTTYFDKHRAQLELYDDVSDVVVSFLFCHCCSHFC